MFLYDTYDLQLFALRNNKIQKRKVAPGANVNATLPLNINNVSFNVTFKDAHFFWLTVTELF